MTEDPDDTPSDSSSDEEPTDSPAPGPSEPNDDSEQTGQGDDPSPNEERSDEAPGDADASPDDDTDDVPVLDGSDIDEQEDDDDSGGLRKMYEGDEAAGPTTPDDAVSDDVDSVTDDWPTSLPGAPESGPTRPEPDEDISIPGASIPGMDDSTDETDAPDDQSPTSEHDSDDHSSTGGHDTDDDEGSAGEKTDDADPTADDDDTESADDSSTSTDLTDDEPDSDTADPAATEQNLDNVRTDEAVVNRAGESPVPGTEDQSESDPQRATAATAAQSGPPDDQEMPLTEHIREMISRLAVVAIIAAGVAVLAYPLSEDIITWMWYYVHPGAHGSCVGEPLNPAHGCAPPHVYGPLEFILTKLKFSGLVGLVTAIPFAVYQTYLFMRPGLYPKERRYYLASVPLSLVLAVIGMAFAFLVILPLLFEYFLQYTADTVDVAFQLSDTIDLMLVLMGWSALIFQIPLMMTLAVMMGVTTRRWMQQKRIYFWAGFGGIAFFFVAADPTGMASVLLTITMIILFEVTLVLLRWTGR